LKGGAAHLRSKSGNISPHTKKKKRRPQDVEMKYYPDIYQIEQHVFSIVVLPTAPAEESGALAVNTEQLRTEPGPHS
jgi:hypothetical protein